MVMLTDFLLCEVLLSSLASRFLKFPRSAFSFVLFVVYRLVPLLFSYLGKLLLLGLDAKNRFSYYS